MLGNHFPKFLDVLRVLQGLHRHQVLVHPAVEVVVPVQDIDHPAAHPGGKVPAGGADDRHPPAGHIFTAVVPHALHHRQGTGVAHAEPFPGGAPKESLSSGGAIEGHVAYNHLVPRG